MSVTSDLIPSIIQKIVSLVHPQSIYLFGSHANGAPHENSDVDICIIKDEVMDKQKTLSDLRLSLWEFPVAMDLVLMSGAEFNQRKNVWWTLQGQIFEKGKVLYDAK